jgi:hypothetical protein
MMVKAIRSFRRKRESGSECRLRGNATIAAARLRRSATAILRIFVSAASRASAYAAARLRQRPDLSAQFCAAPECFDFTAAI